MLQLEETLKALNGCVELLDPLPPENRSFVLGNLEKLFAKDQHMGNGKPSKIRDLVESEDFLALNTVQGGYLALLRQLYEEDPQRFAEVAPTVKGTKRQHFAESEEEIKESGTGTKPAQICPGGWWADLNNSTPSKQDYLQKLMVRLGYPRADVNLACKALR